MKKIPRIGTKITLIAATVIFSTLIGYSEKFVPKSDLIRSVTGYIRSKYVNSEQIEPKKMFIRALKELSLNVPPIVIRTEERSDGPAVNIRIGSQETKMTFNGLDTIDKVEYSMQKVAQYIKKNINETEIEPSEIDQQLLNGVLKSLDPHSTLFSPKVYDSFSTDSQGSFGGVGMYIGLEKGQLTVVSLIKDTPAARSGLKAKDKIVKINDVPTLNMSTEDALSLLRGKPGEPVDIYATRGNATEEKKFTVIRKVIPIKSVSYLNYEKDKKRLFYMNLRRFNRTTFDELNKALTNSDYDLSDFKGFVIDLRGNPGGFLDQAIEIADKFLNSGIIVSTASFEKKSIYDFKAKSYNSIDNVPIILISNHQSASASEIFIAALKNNRRAVAIGDYTFGKGSVQTIFELRNQYALKLTTSQYLVPDRKSIQIVGVAPDILLNPLAISEENLRIVRPEFQYGEGRLEESIVEWSGKKEDVRGELNYVFTPPKEIEKEFIDEILPGELEQDFAFVVAKNVLFDYSDNKKYDSLLKNLLNYTDKENENQEKKLVAKLKKHSIHWEKETVKQVKEKKIELSHFIEKKNNDGKWQKIEERLWPESYYRLVLQAKNLSKGNLQRVYGILKSSNSLFERTQVVFGNLKPGEISQWNVPFRLSKGIVDMDFIIEVELFDPSGKFKVAKINLIQQATQTPRFNFNILSERDKDRLNVTVFLKNIGKQDSEELVVVLKNEEKTGIDLLKARANILALKVGEEKKLNFSLEIKSPPKDRDIDLVFGIQDMAFGHNSVNQSLKISLDGNTQDFKNSQPDIRFDNYPLVSGDSKIQIQGKIFDDKFIKDYYVYLNGEKILYRKIDHNSQKTKTSFSFPITLKEDMNRLTFATRDSDNLSNQKYLFVRKE